MQTVTRTIVVLLAMALVSWALLGLAQTGWAEGLRASALQRVASEGEASTREARTAMAGMGIVVGLIRPTIVLLIPGWLAYRVLGFIKRRTGLAR